MKILQGKVDWMAGRANRPNLYLLVDSIPNEALLRYRKRSDFYFAEHEGYCHFYSHGGHGNNGGFGGRKFAITMADGEKRVLEGPWSSSPSTMNEHGFGPYIEARLTNDPNVYARGHTFYGGGAVLISLLRDCADVIEVGDGYSWRPGAPYAAEVMFPKGSKFALACTGYAASRKGNGSATSPTRFVALPEVFPDGVRVGDVREAILAATEAEEHKAALAIARRYFEKLIEDANVVEATSTLLRLTSYEPAVKLPDGSYWIKPA